ncbi:MAG: choice-of-anchor I domain-containing protein, partial [Bacteroidia bacterium]
CNGTNWINALGLGSAGYDFKRNPTATPLPSTTFVAADWTISDFNACSDNYDLINSYEGIRVPPSAISLGATYGAGCSSATVSVTGTEAVAGGAPLTYQWYYSAPGDIGWTMVSNGGVYSGATLATLTISDTLEVNDTVYFDLVINDDANSESDEYIICKLQNGINVNYSSSAQHTLFIRDNDRALPIASNQLSLNLLTSFNNGSFSTNSSEISAYDVVSKRIFIANSIGNKLDIADFSNPTAPLLKYSVDLSSYGAINSVAVHNALVAVALENPLNRQDSGRVVFLDTNGVFINQVNVGIQPDMIIFNHAGTKVYTANEAEPSDDYINDPDGSISVINISAGILNLNSSNVTHVTFTSFNGQEAILRTSGVRIYGQSGIASKDLEPEYITIADDDSKCWVTLQENNAIA